MRSWRRFVVFMLSLVMLVSATAGCKSGSKTATTGKAATAGKATTAAKAGATGAKTTAKTSTNPITGADLGPGEDPGAGNGPSEEPAEDPSDEPDANTIDMGGRTIRLVSLWLPPAPDRESLLGVGTEEYDAFYYSLQEAEKKYNVKLDLVKGSSTVRNDFTNAVLAGLVPCEALETTNTHPIPNLALQNMIIPVDEYVDFTSPLWSFGAVNSISYWKGKHWGIASGIMYPGQIGSCVIYNKDIFNQEGIQDPQDLMDQDNWNWDTFLEAARLATKDLNGDGVVDQFGMTGSYDRFINNLIFSNGGRLTYLENDKSYVSITDPKVIKAVQFGMDLVNVYKVVEPLTYTTKRNYNNRAEIFDQGKAGMLITEGYDLKYRIQAGINAALAMLPKGPDANVYGNVMISGRFFIFPITLTSDPAAGDIIRVVADANCSWDKSKSFWQGERKVYTTPQYGTERDRKISSQYAASVDYPHEQAYPGFPGKYQSAVLGVFSGQTGLGAALESIRAPLQTILDDTINK